VAEKEYLTERIKYLSDLLKLSCVFLIAIGSGTIGLFLGKLSPIRMLLAVAGTGLIIAFVAACWQIDLRIRKLMERLKEVPEMEILEIIRVILVLAVAGALGALVWRFASNAK
jgi:hypothetical protein